MIEVQNIYKSFNKKNVLNNVSLSIAHNEILAIQGPSGAGKTTLLKSIGLLDTIDNGEITFYKQKITQLNEKEKNLFRNKEIGFIFQFHNLLPEFSVLENILIPALIHKNNLQEAQEKAERLMNALNIRHKKNDNPNILSGGEQQRVAIARALINSPKAILADEPTGNLDSKQSINMFNLFHQIAKNFQTTFVIITHNNQLAKMCNRIVKLKDGEIIN